MWGKKIISVFFNFTILTKPFPSSSRNGYACSRALTTMLYCWLFGYLCKQDGDVKEIVRIPDSVGHCLESILTYIKLPVSKAIESPPNSKYLRLAWKLPVWLQQVSGPQPPLFKQAYWREWLYIHLKVYFCSQQVMSPNKSNNVYSQWSS